MDMSEQSAGLPLVDLPDRRDGVPAHVAAGVADNDQAVNVGRWHPRDGSVWSADNPVWGQVIEAAKRALIGARYLPEHIPKEGRVEKVQISQGVILSIQVETTLPES
jgi:hypothetical protein